MSSDSGWSIISAREQEKDAARQKQAMLYEQVQASSSVANLTTRRRLGTSRTHVQMEDPQHHLPPPPPLTIPNGFHPKRAPSKEFPRTSEDKHEHEPPKGTSFKRKLKTSLLGGKNPFTSLNKAAEKEKEKQEPIVIPPSLSPEPDAVLVPRPDVESNVSTPEPPVPPKSPRVIRSPPVTSYPRLYSSQHSQPAQPRRAPSTTPAQSSESILDSAKIERPPSRSRDIPIVEISGGRAGAPHAEREPVLGALQQHHGPQNRAIAPPPPQSIPPPPRPLPPQPTPTLPQPAPPSVSRPRQSIDPPAKVIVTSVPQPVRPPPESLHPAAHYRDSPSAQYSSSTPPVVRYKRSSDRTSYGTTATTPSLSSSVRTHASQATSDVPPRDMERITWAAAPAPAPRPAISSHARAVSADHTNAVENWEQSMNKLSLMSKQDYHVEMPKKKQTSETSPPPLTQPANSMPKKLQRHATTTATTPVVTHYYYDPTPPLISRISRLSDLKEDYRNPGSERSDIMRRKINYLRFELGYTGLRRARGDGNCFYRSFAFAWLEQIYFADDRALAVVNALEHLEVAQNLVDVAIPDNRFSQQMHLFLRDVIRNMEIGTMDQRRLSRIFQDQRDSDDIVAYVRLLASAYIRLTPDMHASVFHPDDPTTVISAPDFCSIYVEQLGQDADHLQISALSRTLNVSVYIYRLDEKVDGVAPNSQDLVAHCTRFTPTDAPAVTDPVTLLFRPGHYDILERHINQ